MRAKEREFGLENLALIYGQLGDPAHMSETFEVLLKEFPESAARALNAFQQLVELVEVEVDLPDPLGPALSYELAGRVELEPEAKQELLESRSEVERLERVAELLEAAAASVALAEEARKRAAGNGRVSPPG